MLLAGDLSLLTETRAEVVCGARNAATFFILGFLALVPIHLITGDLADLPCRLKSYRGGSDTHCICACQQRLARVVAPHWGVGCRFATASLVAA